MMISVYENETETMSSSAERNDDFDQVFLEVVKGGACVRVWLGGSDGVVVGGSVSLDRSHHTAPNPTPVAVIADVDRAS